MTGPGREPAAKQSSLTHDARLAETLVTLADTLVEDYDIIDLLHILAERSVELLDAGAGGIMLTDQRGGLRYAAATSDTARLLELFELQAEEGPCLDAFTSGDPTICRDLATETRWPRFTPQAKSAGFRAVSAIPLRLRAQTIGALNLFHTTPGGLDDNAQRIGQALADVATIGILQQRTRDTSTLLTEQLQSALNSRIAIEQAKGMLVQYSETPLDMSGAFAILRSYSRNQNVKLSDLAVAVVDGKIDIQRLTQG